MIFYVFKMAVAIVLLCENNVEAIVIPSIFHCDMYYNIVHDQV